MKWPGDLSTAKRTSRDGPLGAFFHWLVGFSANGFEAGDVGEREMRRIRAKQIGAVRGSFPFTMTINLANVAIVLFVFWNTGLQPLSQRVGFGDRQPPCMATRSWARSRRSRRRSIAQCHEADARFRRSSWR